MKESPRTKRYKLFAKAIDARNAGRYSIARKWFAQAAAGGTRKHRAICWALAADCEDELHNPTAALECLRRAERYQPEEWLIQVYIGEAQLDLGRPKLAERALRKSLARRAVSSRGRGLTAAWAAISYILLADALRQQDRFSEQIHCYKCALRLEPNNKEAHHNLGASYKLDRQYRKAEKHLRRAVAIDPKYAEAYAELGHVLFKKGSCAEAGRALRRSVRLDPEYYWSRLYLALTHWVLGRLKEAEEQYRAAVRINPSDSLAHAMLGDFLSSVQRGNPMLYLKKALRLDPTSNQAHYHMGKHLWRQGRDGEAEHYLKKAARKGDSRAKPLLAKLRTSG